MANCFSGARLKLERAEHHIGDLLSRAQRFADEHPHELTVERELRSGNDFLCVSSAQPLPDELLLILGDALHNLRSALDHAWFNVVFEPNSRTMFPFRESRNELEAAVNVQLKGSPYQQKVTQLLLGEIEPYVDGKGAHLFGLHKLDIEDKHKLLITHHQFTLFECITFKDKQGDQFARPVVVTAGEVTKIPFEEHPHFDLVDLGPVTWRVQFGAGTPMEGKFIRESLKELVSLTTGVVDGLERAKKRE